MATSTNPTAAPPMLARPKAATPKPRRRKRPAFERSVESYLREVRERIERLTGGGR